MGTKIKQGRECIHEVSGLVCKFLNTVPAQYLINGFFTPNYADKLRSFVGDHGVG